MSEKEIAETTDDIIAFADIGEFIDRPISEYSSGMTVRLAFATQVHVDPDILIVDEALSVGDIFFQNKCITKIKELVSNGTTLFFVSHGLNTVKSICERAIYLRNGELIADGPSEEVCEIYQNSTTSVDEQDLAVALEQAKQFYGTESEWLEIPVKIQTNQSDFDNRVSSRSGGGEVRFIEFSILNADGVRVESIENASPVTLLAVFEATSDVPEGAEIGILLRDYNGVDLVAYNTNFFGLKVPPILKGCKYAWRLEISPPLAQGHYSFHCGIKPHAESSYFYDRVFGAGALEVANNPVGWGNYGGRFIQSPRNSEFISITETL